MPARWNRIQEYLIDLRRLPFANQDDQNDNLFAAPKAQTTIEKEEEKFRQL